MRGELCYFQVTNIIKNRRHFVALSLVSQGKLSLKNKRRSSILMTCHYPDPGGASDCFFFASSNQKHYTDLGMEFLRSVSLSWETSGVAKCWLPSRLTLSARYWDFLLPRGNTLLLPLMQNYYNCFTFLGDVVAFTFMRRTITSHLIQFSTACYSLSRRVRTQTSSESSISAFKACSCWGSLKVHSRQCYRCFRKQVPFKPFSAIDPRRVLLCDASRITHQ